MITLYHSTQLYSCHHCYILYIYNEILYIYINVSYKESICVVPPVYYPGDTASFSVSVFSSHLALHEVAVISLRFFKSCHSNESSTCVREEKTSEKDEGKWN